MFNKTMSSFPTTSLPSFGTQNQQQTTTATTMIGTFGNKPTFPQTSFSGLGTQNQQQTGSTTAPFGATSSTSFNFNNPSQQTTTTANAFGATNTFGNTNAFGGANTFGTTSSFGQKVPAFGSTSLTTTGTNAFGTTTNAFGTNTSAPNPFAQKPANPFSSFPSNQSTLGNQNQQQQQSQMQQQQQQVPAGASIYTPKIYNDERDDIVRKFNIVQGHYGTGKAYSSAYSQPHEFTEKDMLNRLKSIAYSELPPNSDDDKIFFLVNITTDESQLRTSLLTYEQQFNSIIFQCSNFKAKLEIRNVLPQKSALLSLLVTDSNTQKPVEESMLRNYFSQQTGRQQLTQIFGGIFVEVLFSSVSSQELNAYLSAPPNGIDEGLWSQAKAENPDSSRFTPVPLIGFNALNNRFKMQNSQIEQQKMRLKNCVEQIKALDNHSIQMKAKYEDCRRKHLKLKNIVLEKMIKLHLIRNMNLPIQPEEDKMRAIVESIQSELYAPNKFQGCLQEIISFMRQTPFEPPRMKTLVRDSAIINDYKQVLAEENRGIMNLVDILHKDLDDIQRLGGRVAPVE